jgi:toxin-antitoxin system PIN domain toxin
MIAVDTNILVYAHRRDSAFHDAAGRCVAELAEGMAPWAIPWPCVHEFYSTVTRRLYSPPSTPEQAIEQIDAWFASPTLVQISEVGTHWATLRDLVGRGKVTGPMVHDARIAAICLSNGVRELWSADRDFGRFPQLRIHNPLI